MNGGTRTPEYLAKFPTGLSPGMSDGDFHLSEGSAILVYLCRANGFTDWYDPRDVKAAARTDQYMSHHHGGARRVSNEVFRPMMTSLLGKTEWTDEVAAAAKKVSSREAANFERAFLPKGGPAFITGSKPTIADLLAYPEFAQVPQVLGPDFELEEGRAKEWVQRMSELDHHDDVHGTTFKLGKLFQSKNGGKK